MPYYGFSMNAIVSLHQLVSNAIILSDTPSDDDENDDDGDDE
jgi:hypothetical protein